jgi:hypothetical protein
MTLPEMTVTLAVASGLTMMTLPVTAAVTEADRSRQAAAFVAGRLRAARQDAVASSRSTGLVFDQQGGRWTFRVCVDGNHNGLRRAELAEGLDRCVAGPFDLGAMFPGANIQVDPDLRGPEGEPGSADPVRFGQSNIASFSASGSGTAGSVFLRIGPGPHYLVRVGGITGRIRVLRCQSATLGWEDL